jgi:hypothetical protein
VNQNPYSVGNNLDPQNADFQGANFEGSVRGMQIIAVALMSGVLFFLGIVLMSTQGDVLSFKQPEIITIIAAGFGLLMIVNHFVIPGIIASTQLKQLISNDFTGSEEATRIDKLVGVYRIQFIIGLALLEGAAFFNLIALMIGNSGFSLCTAGVLFALMLMRFPTRDKVSFWVQDKLRELS